MTRLTRRRWKLPFRCLAMMAMVVCVWCAAPAAACPNCTEILNESRTGTIDRNQAEGLAKGYYWSILLMIAVPFTLVGGLGTMLYLNIRNSAPATNPGGAPRGARPGCHASPASE